MGGKLEQFTIVVDTRERRPFFFRSALKRTLKTGDYSISGLENRLCIEKKGKSDIYACIGRDRNRFKKELERMAEMDYAAIVIECSLMEFLMRPVFSRVNPKAAINSIISWTIRYGVHVFFASDRRHAKAITYRILEKFWKHKGNL